MNKELLPPLEQKTADLLFQFLRHLVYVVRANSGSAEERKKMNRVVFEVLALIDGCYEELPAMELTIDNVRVSSCMHDYFAAFMENGVS